MLLPVCTRESVLKLATLVALVVLCVYAISCSVFPGGKRRSSSANIFGSRVTESLQLSLVVVRHGSRGPIGVYPDYPYQVSSVWPDGLGQLTNRGRAELYRMGVKCRSMYNGFLSQEYSRKEFLAYSTVYDRALMSAQAFLTGLYPPRGRQVWKADLQWQPIPVFPTEVDRTGMVHYNISAVCPRFHEAQQKAMQNFVEVFGPNLTAIMEYARPYTGLPSLVGLGYRRIFDSLIFLYEPIFCSEGEVPLPAWTEKIFPEPLISIIPYCYSAISFGSETQIRLFEGVMFKEILNTLRAKMNGTLTPDRRMILYSGHDVTIYGLQAIMGLLRDGVKMVKIGSALIFELHKDPLTGAFYMQLLYIDGSSADLEPTVVDIPGCAFPCDLDTLSAITERYHNITDVYQECQLNYTSTNS